MNKLWGIDMGHTLSGADTGASGIVTEQIEDRKIGKALISDLESVGDRVVNCTTDSASSLDASLAHRYNTANNAGVDGFVSLHLNSSKDPSAHGVEVLIHARGGEAEQMAKRVLVELAKLGYYNRGIRVAREYLGYDLAVLKYTNAPAILVECGFVSSQKDCNLLNPSAIAAAICKGLTGQEGSGSGDYDNTPSLPEAPKGFYESSETRTNATLVGEGSIEVLDEDCKPIPGRYIDSLDNLFVLGIYPSRKYIEVIYPGKNSNYHAYIDIKHYSRLSFDYHMKYQNDNGVTYVWWDPKNVNVTDCDETLQPGQKASPMYRTNGWLRITFYRKDGTPSDGYVRYEGEQSQKFYEDVKQGIVRVNTSLNVRDDVNGNIIGSVFNNERVTILGSKNGWYHIEYNTSHGKKQGYVSSKYVEII
ncbi:N-acetylmuramoyl-L-alanine amidase [Clostridium phage A2]|nr:N-acetylmuramoyl-L-alanine amidase [Clostridium phage A2]WAB24175.1 N-acetylmuramoyl-L-alanine amidase [Clostridium phage C2]WAB24252.1 N-acetylmuramoyl-L-alanine amidase [Clostridium phage H1]WAB24329.1 N-acetylmuramoyl-L-alanine amidase [Clostridium phage D1]WAB24406.1 N-acetylmuramoyl-L-alanine amidase [Clostridium phage E1]